MLWRCWWKMASFGGQKVIPGGRRPPGITLSRGTKNKKNKKNEKKTKKTCEKCDPTIQNRHFFVKIDLIWVQILTPWSKSSQFWSQISQISLAFRFSMLDVRDVWCLLIGVWASIIHQLCHDFQLHINQIQPICHRGTTEKIISGTFRRISDVLLRFF